MIEQSIFYFRMTINPCTSKVCSYVFSQFRRTSPVPVRRTDVAPVAPVCQGLRPALLWSGSCRVLGGEGEILIIIMPYNDSINIPLIWILWVYDWYGDMVLPENVVYPYTQWLCWSLSLLNGYNWGYTPFSDIPIWCWLMMVYVSCHLV